MRSSSVRHAGIVPGRWSEVLGWGAYLGCSWTWCIGMFLPILLARDYGPWAWVVFAAPNVLGAAAMGFVLRKAVGRQWIAAHAGALTWFMRITLIFQWFFLGWIAAGAHLWWVGLTVLLVGGLWPQPQARGWRLISWATWLGSIACFAVFLARNPVGIGGETDVLNQTDTFPITELLWLAPVCVFGFGLCPYLDLTFHLARRQLNAAESRASFTIGFVVFFGTMLAFTLVYAPLFLKGGVEALAARTAVAIAVVTHIALQVGFTTFAFFDAFDRMRPRERSGIGSISLLGLLIIAYLVGLLLKGEQWFSRDASEIVYRTFMGFYGLVFPAYVWICVLPGRGASAAAPERRLRVMWTAVVLAAPFFSVGFIGQRTVWLIPGLLIVLGARLLFRAPRAPKYYAPEYEPGYVPTESAAVPATHGAA